LESSLVDCVPRLIQDELRRGLRQYTSTVSAQLASRIDRTPLDSSHEPPTMMSRAANHSASAGPITAHRRVTSQPITAQQLLRCGQVNSAFEMVKFAVFVSK